MTKPATPFIGFRPGNLVTELDKRGPRATMSLVAKDLVEETLWMLSLERRRLARTFSIAEMQVAFAVFDRQESHSTCDPLTVVRAIHEGVDSVRDIIAAYGVDLPDFSRRLMSLTPGEAFALRDAARQFRSLASDERLGPDGYPSVEVLQNIGVVAAGRAPASWGVCLVHLADGNDVVLPLRRPAWLVSTRGFGHSPEYLTDRVIEYAERKRLGVQDPILTERGLWAAYRIAKGRSLRRFAIWQPPIGGDPRFEELANDEALRLVNDSSGEPLLLAGLNAPEIMRDPDPVEERGSKNLADEIVSHRGSSDGSDDPR